MPVRTLTADRDRLNARLASLEHNLDDMTGSIKTVMRANAAVAQRQAAEAAEPDENARAAGRIAPPARTPLPTPPVAAKPPCDAASNAAAAAAGATSAASRAAAAGARRQRAKRGGRAERRRQN